LIPSNWFITNRHGYLILGPGFSLTLSPKISTEYRQLYEIFTVKIEWAMTMGVVYGINKRILTISVHSECSYSVVDVNVNVWRRQM